MANKFVVRVPYEYDSQALSDATGLKCLDPSRASQEFKDEVDINTIAKRFGLTGELPENVPMVLQGDFTQVVNFQGAWDLIVKARESFQAMPAEVRAEFDNDAAKFVEFTSNPKNFDRVAELGLVRPEVVEARAKKAKEAHDALIESAAAARAEAILRERHIAPEGLIKGNRKGGRDQSST